MKIFGPGQTRINAYQNHQKVQVEKNKKTNREDQLQISKEAKHLQESEVTSKRDAFIEKIKEDVQADRYKINYEKTAQKLINYWSR